MGRAFVSPQEIRVLVDSEDRQVVDDHDQIAVGPELRVFPTVLTRIAPGMEFAAVVVDQTCRVPDSGAVEVDPGKGPFAIVDLNATDLGAGIDGSVDIAEFPQLFELTQTCVGLQGPFDQGHPPRFGPRLHVAAEHHLTRDKTEAEEDQGEGRGPHER